MDQGDRDPFDQYEAPGLGGPARLDIHVRAGDAYALTLEFDELPDPTEARVEVRKANAPLTDPAVAEYTVGAGITANYAATPPTMTLLIPSATTLTWEDLDYPLSWGWALKAPAGDPETIVNGIVYVSTRTVKWP